MLFSPAGIFAVVHGTLIAHGFADSTMLRVVGAGAVGTFICACHCGVTGVGLGAGSANLFVGIVPLLGELGVIERPRDVSRVGIVTPRLILLGTCFSLFKL